MALACDGLFLRATECDAEELWLRFVDGRPASALTIPFLADCWERLPARGKTAFSLVWDNAPWHGSKAVRSWIREHNWRVE